MKVRFRYLFGALICLTVTGCGRSDDGLKPRDQLRRCAEAMTLEAGAYERLARIRRGAEEDQLLDRLTSEAYESAARYRASACLSFPPDEFSDEKND